MKMVDLGNQRGPLYIIDTATSVDCTKELRYRRTFRSLIECMVPYCCSFQQHELAEMSENSDSGSHKSITMVAGTFFGFRKGRVNFCIQENSHKSAPLLLLEFAVPTSYLAKEMKHGLLRIALECSKSRAKAGSGLFSVPVWTMYCNGRRVGYALSKRVSEDDLVVLKTMRDVSVGAGVLPGLVKKEEGDLMYLRAKFERVIGSADSESFHMLNPVGSVGQELSIFFFRG